MLGDVELATDEDLFAFTIRRSSSPVKLASEGTGYRDLAWRAGNR